MGPLYIMIKDELLRLIENHVYREGELIPSEDELAETYGVSRPTARRAVQLLVDAGYLERRPYHGTIVTPPKVDQGFATQLRSFNDEMVESHRVPRTQVILARRARASGEVAARLELDEDAEVFKLVRLRYTDDIPNVLVGSYVPMALFPGIGGVDFTATSLYDYFESQGRPVVRAHRHLEVLKAEPSLSTLLDIPAGDPVYRFTTVARTESGHAAEYSIASYRGESNAFEFDANLKRVDKLPEEEAGADVALVPVRPDATSE